MILKIISINNPTDYYKLTDVIPRDYLSPNLIDLFQKRLNSSIKSIVVEYPYVDKDYRSTYYNFYSKRHRNYDKFCFRLHFFEKPFESEDDLPKNDDSYQGSIVLRPTEVTPLGRTQLSPKAIRNFKGFICESTFENNLMGVPLKIKCFPHIMQDTDVTVCAHAVCWMIARYYSEKYVVYPERLLFDIAESIKDISGGRLIPSRGLTLGQISEIFSTIGFYPEIFIRDLYEDTSFFYDILYTYVESGIPIVAAMGEKEHAVAVIGHGPVCSCTEVAEKFDDNLVNARQLIDYLIINDDNFLPYNLMKFETTGEREDGVYRLEDIDGFVVPLYEKMYLSAENVLRLYHKIFYGKLVDIPDKDKKRLFRVYMTSSRSYKRELRKSKLMNPSMQSAQLELPMPKFIWVVEIASPTNYDKLLTDYRWIIDATANHYERYPFLFIHDRNKMIIHDRALEGELYRILFDSPVQPYELYQNNLRRYT
jgi:hypothetical protein